MTTARPPALLVLENGRAFRGHGFGAEGESTTTPVVTTKGGGPVLA